MLLFIQARHQNVKKGYTGPAQHTHTHTHTTGERTKLFQYHMNLSACWIKLGVVCVFQKFRHLTVQGNKSKIIHFVGLKIKMMCIFFYINQVSDLLLKED